MDNSFQMNEVNQIIQDPRTKPISLDPLNDRYLYKETQMHITTENYRIKDNSFEESLEADIQRVLS